MKSILFCILLLFTLNCYAAHTVHVDNVFPNFGDTVLVSGPFTTDSIVIEELNVGSLTINSFDGFNITTNNGFTIDGASINAESASNTSLHTINDDSTFTIVAATTIDIFGGDLTLEAGDELSISALGSFEFLSSGDLTLFANSASFTGDFLEVSSAVGSLTFVGDNISSESSALSLIADSDIAVLVVSSMNFDIQQAIEIFSGNINFSSENLDIFAERNNILLEGYVSLSLDASIFDIQVKGDATIESANGNLQFFGMNSVLFDAQDDIVLESNDAVKVEIDGDSLITSSGNTFFVSDSESFYNFQSSGEFIANNLFESVSAEFMVESTSGNINFITSNGPISSSSDDYTHFFSDSKLSYTANDNVLLNAFQGIDFRAERGRLFIGKLPADPSGSTPITFTADDDLYFDAGDLSVSVDTIDITSNDVRFETEDAAVNAIQDWDIDTDISFTIENKFSLGSSNILISASEDLNLLATNDINFTAVDTDSSEIIIDNEFDITDIATNGNIFHTGKYFTLSSTGDLEMTAESSMNIRGREGILIEGETTVTTTTSTLTNNIHWKSNFDAVNDIFVDSETSSISFSGGRYEIDNRNNFEISTLTNFLVTDSANLDFDADGLAEYDINDSVTHYSRFYTIINGNQNYNEYENVLFDGDLTISSPDNTDIFLEIDNLATIGPLLIDGFSVIIDIGNDASFTPFEFEISSSTEELITLESGGDIEVNGDVISFSVAEGDLDNEFYFQSDEETSIGALNMEFDIEHEGIVNSDTVVITAFNFEVSADTVYINALEDLKLESGDDFTLDANHDIYFRSEYEDIVMEFDTVDFISQNEIFFRSNDNISFFAEDFLDIRSPREFTFNGGDAVFDSTDFEFDVADDTDIHGFDSFSISAIGELQINADSVLDIHGEAIELNAVNILTIDADTAVTILSGPNEPLEIIQLNPAGTSAVVGDDVRFQSNDMMNIDIGLDWTITASANMLLETSAQDAGQLLYARESFAFTMDESIDVIVGDNSFDGKNIEFINEESSIYIGNNGINILAGGSEYNSHFDRYVGAEFISEIENIIFTIGDDLSFNGWNYLLLQSLDGDISHETTTGDITITSINEGLVIKSADELQFTTTNNNLEITLDAYSIWKASDELSVTSDVDFSFSALNNIDLITDRGEISFVYDGDTIMSFNGNSIIGDGASSFSWRFDGNVTTTSGSIEIYGDSLLEVESSTQGTGLPEQISIISGGNTYFISSLNNDIDIESDSVTANIDGFIDFYAGKDVIWSSGKDDSSFIAGEDINFISEGSINILQSSSTVFTSAAHLTITSSNLVEFEAENDIDVGSDTSIITIIAGGDGFDHGISITADETVEFASDNDIAITGNEYFINSFDSNFVSETTTTIQSFGAGSFGQDITFDSIDSNFIVNGLATTLSASSIRYEYDSTLDLIADGTDIQLISSSFVEVAADKTFTYEADGDWTINSGSHVYSSKMDTMYNVLGDSSFTVTQTTLFESDGNILMSTADDFDISTIGTNSPISFETQGLVSEFNIEGTSSTEINAARKLSFQGTTGVFFSSEQAITLNAKDDFTFDSKADLILRSIDSSDINFIGESGTGSGSKFTLSSSGTMFQHAGESISLSAVNEDISFIPDHNLSFISKRTEHAIERDTEFLITVADDLNANIGKDFTFSSENTNFSGFTMDWKITGTNNIGAQFTSHSGDISFNQDDNLLSIIVNDLYSVSSAHSITQTSTSETNFNADIILATTLENPTGIEFSATNSILFSAGEDLTVSAFGESATSGYIDLLSNGSSDGSEYAWFDRPYGAAFVATNADIFVDIQDARFIFENLDTLSVLPDSDGILEITAFGRDENGYGIEVQTTDLTIQSQLNVVYRSENIEFIELATEDYGNYGFELDLYYFTNLFRPTIQAIHDQTYTSLGKNENGNGIEITCDIPGQRISFEVDNVNFDSSGSISILADNIIEFRSEFDTKLESHSSIYITGEGNSADKNSVYIGAMEPNLTTDTASVEFNAVGDIFIESSTELLAAISDEVSVSGSEFLMEGGNVDFNVVDTFGVDGNDVSITTDSFIEVLAEDIFFTAQNEIDIIGDSSLTGTGDIYFGAGGGIGRDITFNGGILNFNSRIVDITSSNELIWPLSSNARDCSVSPNGMWFTRQGLDIVLVVCINGGETRISMQT